MAHTNIVHPFRSAVAWYSVHRQTIGTIAYTMALLGTVTIVYHLSTLEPYWEDEIPKLLPSASEIFEKPFGYWTLEFVMGVLGGVLGYVYVYVVLAVTAVLKAIIHHGCFWPTVAAYIVGWLGHRTS